MIRAIVKEAPEKSDAKTDFERIALPHLDSVYRVARYMTRNDHDADDLVQEAYYRAFRAFHRFRADTNCKAWLLKILSNLNVDRFSRCSARFENVRYEDVQPFMGTGEGDSLPDGGRSFSEGLDDEVSRAVASIPADFRIPLLLSAVEDLSYAEIARALRCPIGTVMSRIFRGRQMLKRQLAGYATANGLRA
ncbi:MAG TPA: sigma-70 family RNA polymerase sigma factor [Planctomycetota bacterium]|nr:sigma-70 family RNA polymerase sigma factor [Planctomycetota bacterium]